MFYVWNIKFSFFHEYIFGVPGPVGRPGAVGSPGTPGATGLSGGPGNVGSTGTTGPADFPGPVGHPGAPGFPGPVGATGFTGREGHTGSTGMAGPSGPLGSPGSATGPSGPAGFPGRNGAIGATGSRGEPGLMGVRGQPGLSPTLPPGALFKSHLTNASDKTGIVHFIVFFSEQIVFFIFIESIIRINVLFYITDCGHLESLLLFIAVGLAELCLILIVILIVIIASTRRQITTLHITIKSIKDGCEYSIPLGTVLPAKSTSSDDSGHVSNTFDATERLMLLKVTEYGHISHRPDISLHKFNCQDQFRRMMYK